MIRLASLKDVDELNEILLNARNYMHMNGNPTQWNGVYPDRDDIVEHINKKDMYVIEIESRIQFAFVFKTDVEPTYKVIDGSWLNDEPYGVFHLVISRMEVKHLGDRMIEFGRQKVDNLRIDTHSNNVSMKKLVERNSFVFTGIIYVEDGTPRNAYQWSRNLNKN